MRKNVPFAAAVCRRLMPVRYRIVLWMVCIACMRLLYGCAPGGASVCIGDDLKLTWQLLHNSTGAEDSCSAVFTFINTGARPVGNNWVMYFNQQTLHPLRMKDSTLGVVEHINGDFYRFVPGPSFMLGPADTIRFAYSYSGIMIKEADAPDGIYLVMQGAKGRDSIQVVRQYNVVPFTDYAALFPGFSHLIPTPESDYARNQALRLLPTDSLCPLIPTPVAYQRLNGSIPLSMIKVVYYTNGLHREAEYLADALLEQFGIQVETHEGNGYPGNAIHLLQSPLTVHGVVHEAYSLDAISGKGVTITGSDTAGVFYGIQSLLLLANNGTKPASSFIPCCRVQDAPRFPFRGFLLDVARNFHTVAEVKKCIDLLALYKINRLNLRLTDDEGWRLAINGLPELTEIGARRGHTLNDSLWLPPSFGSGPFADTTAGNKGNGYYSREDFIALLRYADQRHVSIIPEICFPSHARAAIKAMEARYQQLLAKGDVKAAEEYRLIDPDDRSAYYSAQQYTDNIVCVARPSVLHFYTKVVSEITDMYKAAGAPLQLFHTGGDEVPAGAWKGSPLCAALLREHPEIKGTRNLQGWFFAQLVDTLSKLKLAVGGWEEVVLSKDSLNRASINPAFKGSNVIPYVWDNTGDNIDLGYRIANAGYPVVMCNVTNLYFDLSYNTDPREPGLYWGGFQDAMDPYVLAPFDVYKSAAYDDFGSVNNSQTTWPGKATLLPKNRKNIIGLQAQLWSETLKRPGMIEYYMLPKLFAYAEKAWAPAPAWENEPSFQKRTAAIDAGWNNLVNRIGRRELPRLDHWQGGYAYRIPPPGAIIENGLLKANTAFPGFTIRYTTDGSEPSMQSALYSGPVKVAGNITLRAFNSTGRGSRTVTIKQ